MKEEIPLAKALEKLAEVLKDPDVAKFIGQAVAAEGVTAAAICGGCCLLLGGGRRRQLVD